MDFRTALALGNSMLEQALFAQEYLDVIANVVPADDAGLVGSLGDFAFQHRPAFGNLYGATLICALTHEKRTFEPRPKEPRSAPMALDEPALPVRA